jgi:hypothetical protein
MIRQEKRREASAAVELREVGDVMPVSQRVPSGNKILTTNLILMIYIQ